MLHGWMGDNVMAYSIRDFARRQVIRFRPLARVYFCLSCGNISYECDFAYAEVSLVIILNYAHD